ncbi:MAG: hypothetical protein Q9223_002612 [Gallowayella weberi]
MPNLSFVLPGLNIALHDDHGLEGSPTATPAHTRSTSPIRARLMPHSNHEAADFVSKLHVITDVHKTNDDASFTNINTAKVEKLFPTDERAMFNIGTPEKTTPAIESGFAKSIAKDTASVPEQFKGEGMAQVSAIDGSASVSATSKIQVLLVYFVFNLGLTLYNKAVMISFPFPFLLTALHAASGMAGTQVLLSRGIFNLKNLTGRDTAMLSAFSILYTANIALSNVSL